MWVFKETNYKKYVICKGYSTTFFLKQVTGFPLMSKVKTVQNWVSKLMPIEINKSSTG